MSGLPLARIQHLLWDLIAAPEGVRPGLAALRAGGRLPVSGLGEVIRGDARMAPEERLDIYASMYFYRLRDALAEDFPGTAAVAGGARFHNLVTDYLLAHPSRHWSLRHLGDVFAGFLAGHDLGRSLPYLADLARLEWARIEVFDAADAAALTREQAAGAGGGLLLRLVPAVRMPVLQWSVAPLWRTLAGGQGGDGAAGTSAAVDAGTGEAFAPPVPVDSPERKPTCILVWRQGMAIRHRTLDGEEQAALESVAAGELGLAGLGERLVERAEDAGEEDPVAAATAALARLVSSWLDQGLLAA